MELPVLQNAPVSKKIRKEEFENVHRDIVF